MKDEPLDVGFSAPFQTYHGQKIQTWLKRNPGRVVSHFQVAGLFNKAYLKAATPANAVHAFAKTGIQPFDRNIFEEWMFEPSSTNDKPFNDDNTVRNNQVQSLEKDVEVNFPEPGT
ncbi:hypothetical protein QE152_g39665 [Popillia japonica]|uniref:Catalase n=1 Tax=Popillia japonica TaxID=7064 RepID=A0AAW1HTP8_POPJA